MRRSFLRFACYGCLSLTLGTATGVAQQPPAATFRSTTRLIVQTVSVKDKEGRPIEGLTANFLGLAARNRRLFAVPDMIKAYRALLARHRGQTSAEVTSAAKLEAGQIRALREALKASLGKDVDLEERVDPALLGGLVVKIGSRMIDSSLRTKLNNMKHAMKEVG